jgi:DNA-binding XRE family transcriptional regulator
MSRSRLSALQPNEHLKQERLLRGWSQIYVANALGTDGYTVNRWERGRARPSPYFRQKLCELFEKNAFDLGLLPLPLGTADPVSPSVTTDSPTSIAWSIPYSHNPCFTGRKEILQSLHSLLTTSQPPALTQVVALSGLGGIGKTQIAIEYAYRSLSKYAAIFWIEAETVENIMSSMVRIAKVIGIPLDDSEMEPQMLIAEIQHWLATHSPWLLILDNLENLELLQRLPLRTSQGAILITTRCQALGTIARGLVVGPMEQEEGILFLLRRSKVLEFETRPEQLCHFSVIRPSEYTASAELVTAMGGLPLALDQAGAYIDETRCSIASYVHLYQQQRRYLLDRRGTPKQDHPHSVTTTFLLAHKRAEEVERIAADVLRVCSLLHTETIPEELFVRGALHLELDLPAADPSRFDRAIAVLRNLSLLQRHSETHMLSTHRLVRVVIEESMSEQERTRWMKRVIAALNAVFPELFSNHWQRCERLISHVLSITSGNADDLENKDLAEILQEAALYLREYAHYKQTDALSRQVRRTKEQRSEWEHPEVAHTT